MHRRTYYSQAFILALLVLGLSTARNFAQAQDNPDLIAPTEALSPEEQRQMFHLPPGFEIQLVACEPEVHKPMNLSFDYAGRLYVTSSLEYPYPAAEGTPGRDTVQILEDLDENGRAHKVTTLIGGLNIPIGVTPILGATLYYSIPSVYRLDEGSHEPRLLYSHFGFRDTHGMCSSMTPWIDGWVYSCHGFANDSEVADAEGGLVRMNSGNTFRFLADGSHVEQYTHGQVNPFGMCFDPLGNVYTSDCHTLPIYMLLRGAWYPSFGKPHDGLGYGPAMIDHLHGSTGIAGVAYYSADYLPEAWRDTVFIGNPVTGRINHDTLEPHGSTYTAIETPDFLWCEDRWFRPVDVKVGPDGALYILDFYNCIIGHYEVPLTHPRRDRERGRVWRVVYKGEDGQWPAPQPPVDLRQLSLEELVARLEHPNLLIRRQVTDLLVAWSDTKAMLKAVTPLLNQDDNQFATAHAMWIVERVRPGGLTQRELATLTGDHNRRIVRVHATKVLAARHVWDEQSDICRHLCLERLKDADAFVQRAAADALGLHPAADNLRPLIELWRSAPADDTHLIHVVRMALRDQLLRDGVYEQAAEIAGGDADFLSRLADVSLGAPTEAAAAFLFAQLQEHGDLPRSPELVQHIAVHLVPDNLGEVADWLEELATNADTVLVRDWLLAMQRGLAQRGLPLRDDLIVLAVAVGQSLLQATDGGRINAGLELAREYRLQPLAALVASHCQADAVAQDVRPQAMDAVIACDALAAVPVLAYVLSDAAEAAPLRQKAAAVLGQINQEASRAALIEAFKTAPESVAVEIAAGLSLSNEGAEALLAEAAQGRVSRRVLTAPQVVERLRARGLPEFDRRWEEVLASLPPADDRLADLIAARAAGFHSAETDPERGRIVYRKLCGNCHRLNNEGAKIGPDLEGVGLRGLERLLEDTLDPSRNVDQSFRATLIETVDGRAITGLALREEGEVLILADANGKEVRLPLAEIDQRALGQLSPMPANVSDLLKEAEYYDLLRYLLEQRTKPAPASE